jgi:hypothetical protein
MWMRTRPKSRVIIADLSPRPVIVTVSAGPPPGDSLAPMRSTTLGSPLVSPDLRAVMGPADRRERMLADLIPRAVRWPSV